MIINGRSGSACDANRNKSTTQEATINQNTKSSKKRITINYVVSNSLRSSRSGRTSRVRHECGWNEVTWGEKLHSVCMNSLLFSFIHNSFGFLTVMCASNEMCP